MVVVAFVIVDAKIDSTTLCFSRRATRSYISEAHLILTVDAKVRSFSFITRKVCVASSLPATVAVIAIILRDVLLIAVLAIDDVTFIHSALSTKAFGQISNIMHFARVPLVTMSALVRFLVTSRGG